MSESETTLCDSKARSLTEEPPSIPHIPSIPAQLHIIDGWDSDELLRAHLQLKKEPGEDEPFDELLGKVQIKLLNIRIRESKKTIGKIAPRRSNVIESELAKAYFQRKVTLWRTFPINDFPSEILGEIFHEVVRATPPEKAATAKLRLTWVCRHFRQVAIDDHTLWRNVWFTDRAPWHRSLEFVRRAGSSPLEVLIKDRNKADEEMPITAVQMSVLLEILLRKVATIRSIVIAVTDIHLALVVLDKFRHASCPVSLEQFELHRTRPPYLWSLDSRHSVWNSPIPLFNGNLPKLKRLTLNSVAIDWNSVSLRNLRYLDLRRVGPSFSPDEQTWRKMLRSPRLSKMALTTAGPGWNGAPLYTIRPETMHNLRQLVLTDMNLKFALYILAYIDAPGLTHLALKNLRGEDYSALLAAVTNRFPALRWLSMHSVELADTPESRRTFVRFLDSVPMLRMWKLTEIRAHVYQWFLEDARLYRDSDPGLTEENKSDPVQEQDPIALCPQLQYVRCPSEDPTTLLAFVAGRQRLGAPIGSLYVPGALWRRIPLVTAEAIRAAIGEVIITEGLVEYVPPEHDFYDALEASVNLNVDDGEY